MKITKLGLRQEVLDALTNLADFVDEERFFHDSRFDELTKGLKILRRIIAIGNRNLRKKVAR